MSNIFIIDPEGRTGQVCEGIKCSQDAMFILGISSEQNPHHLCTECLGEIAKVIIDALV